MTIIALSIIIHYLVMNHKLYDYQMSPIAKRTIKYSLTPSNILLKCYFKYNYLTNRRKESGT